MSLNLKLSLFFLLLTLNSTLAQTHDFERYRIKSAIIKYKLEGMQTGTAITYFDNYGMQEANYETASLNFYGTKQETETVNYLRGYWQYTIDLKTNTGTKTKNTILESLVENSDGDLEQLGLEMFRSMGGEMTGTEKVLDKICDVWELESMGTKVWVWKNIPLKSVTEMMGLKITRTATSIEENIEIPSEKLQIPSGIEFTEYDINNLDKLMQETDQE